MLWLHNIREWIIRICDQLWVQVITYFFNFDWRNIARFFPRYGDGTASIITTLGSNSLNQIMVVSPFSSSCIDCCGITLVSCLLLVFPNSLKERNSFKSRCGACKIEIPSNKPTYPPMLPINEFIPSALKVHTN